MTGTAARTATEAAKELLKMSAQRLKTDDKPLVVADMGHYTAELYEWVSADATFDLLTPAAGSKALEAATIAPDQFQPHWAGYAVTARPFHFKNANRPFCRFIQRKGERAEDYDFKAFLCTSRREQLGALSEGCPDRWHIEEFFNRDQALGWNRAGTMNLNIQYGKTTMSLLAQAALHMLRQPIGEPVSGWDCTLPMRS